MAELGLLRLLLVLAQSRCGGLTVGATTGKPLGLSDVERLERDLWFSPRGQETVTQVAKFGAHQATLLRFNGPATSRHPELEGSRLPRIELSEYPDRLDNCKIEYRASAIFLVCLLTRPATRECVKRKSA